MKVLQAEYEKIMSAAGLRSITGVKTNKEAAARVLEVRDTIHQFSQLEQQRT